MATSNLKLHKHILLCGDNFNSLGLVRSLGEEGLSVYVIVFGGSAHCVNRSRYVRECDIVDTLTEGFKLLLLKYGNEPLKPFLYSGSDNVVGILDQNLDLLVDRFYLFRGREQGIITKAMNKHAILEMGGRVGLNVLQNVVVKKGVVPKEIDYPIITKAISPILQTWKSDMIVCKNEQDLQSAFKSITSEDVLIQKYLFKKNELAINGISYNDGNNIVAPYEHKYYRTCDDGYGGYLYLTPCERPDLMTKVQRILKEVGYNGIFEVEFLIDQKDELYFLEINFRNACFNYAHTFGGFNFPFLWAKATLEGEVDTSTIKCRKLINALAESDDYRNEVVRGGKSFLQWYKSFHHIDCYLIWNWRDIKPGLFWWMHKIITHIKKGR